MKLSTALVDVVSVLWTFFLRGQCEAANLNGLAMYNTAASRRMVFSYQPVVTHRRFFRSLSETLAFSRNETEQGGSYGSTVRENEPDQKLPQPMQKEVTNEGRNQTEGRDHQQLYTSTRRSQNSTMTANKNLNLGGEFARKDNFRSRNLDPIFRKHVFPTTSRTWTDEHWKQSEMKQHRHRKMRHRQHQESPPRQPPTKRMKFRVRNGANRTSAPRTRLSNSQYNVDVVNLREPKPLRSGIDALLKLQEEYRVLQEEQRELEIQRRKEYARARCRRCQHTRRQFPNHIYKKESSGARMRWEKNRVKAQNQKNSRRQHRKNQNDKKHVGITYVCFLFFCQRAIAIPVDPRTATATQSTESAIASPMLKDKRATAARWDCTRFMRRIFSFCTLGKYFSFVSPLVQNGFWNLQPNRGCEICDCDPWGADPNYVCDERNGKKVVFLGHRKCNCKEGVGGDRCDTCLPGYWGFSSKGCKPCESCPSGLHQCDPRTGRCLCPPLTEGRQCEKCVDGTYNYDPVHGCTILQKTARQSKFFSSSTLTEMLHRVVPVYYDYPDCQECRCSHAGTDPSQCDAETGLCACSETGQCKCKRALSELRLTETSRTAGSETLKSLLKRKSGFRVPGRRDLNISLVENPEGPSDDYGYGGGPTHHEGIYEGIHELPELDWTHLFYYQKYFEEFFNYHGYHHPHTVSLFGDRDLARNDLGNNVRLNMSNGLYMIPGKSGDYHLGTEFPLDHPVYWQLGDEFLGDKVLSYNGYIRFRVTDDGQYRFSPSVLEQYPVIRVQGNWRLTLEHFPDEVSPSGEYRVSLRDLSLDVAVPTYDPSLRHTSGVEKCECPMEYNATSCQDPARGYYRWRRPDFLTSDRLLDLVGIAKPCRCNGHAAECDKETGVCINCAGFTTGDRCELCLPGYYGRPEDGPCQPCACPNLRQNFASTCRADPIRGYICNCQEGYAGERCERCDYGYYGNPLAPGGKCSPCNCNPFGVVRDGCDDETGQCFCKPGISGRDCSICRPRHVMTEQGCASCDEDECAGPLLAELKRLALLVDQANITDQIAAPWGRLWMINNQTDYLRRRLDIMEAMRGLLSGATFELELYPHTRGLLNKAEDTLASAQKSLVNSQLANANSTATLTRVRELSRFVKDVVSRLQNYAVGDTSSINIDRALEIAEQLLRDLRAMDFDGPAGRAEAELSSALELIRRIERLMLDLSGLMDLIERMKETRRRVGSFEEYLLEIKRRLGENKQLTKENQEILSQLRSAISELQGAKDLFLLLHSMSKKLLEEGKQWIEEARKYFLELDGMFLSLVDKTSSVEEEEWRLRQLLPKYKEKYVTPAVRHAALLMSQADKINVQFNSTREVAQYAVQAVNAYKNIVDSLAAARDAALNARKAARKAYDLVRIASYLGGAAALSKADAAHDKSLMALQHAEELLDRIRSILQKKLDRLKATGYKTLTEISQKIDSLDATYIQTQISRTITKYSVLNNETKVVSYANFDDLKSKIQRAREAASNILVSLSGREEGSTKCVRTYSPFPKFESSPLTTIVMSFGLSTEIPQENTVLFHWKGSKESVMSLELVDLRPVFTWKLPGKEQRRIQALDTVIKSEDLKGNDQLWFRIEAIRTGNNGKVRVSRVVEPVAEWSESDKNEDDDVTSLFDTSEVSEMSVGNAETIGFVGCMFELFVNGRKVNLWDFSSTEDGCGACVEGPQPPAPDDGAYSFNGRGYSNLTTRSPSLGYYQVTIPFRTFDSDALLFLTRNKLTGSSFSLELVDGKARLLVVFDFGAKVWELRSTKRMNTGKWTKVGFIFGDYRGGKQVMLKANGEPNQAEYGQGNELQFTFGDTVYFGGVPPTFVPDPNAGYSLRGYRGCMRTPEVANIGQNLFQGEYFGIDNNCALTQMTKAEVFPSGYISMARDERSLKDMTLSFRTTVPSGRLLEVRSLSGKRTCTLMLKEGGIWFMQESLGTQNSERFNDGKTHTIRILETGENSKSQRLLFYVDDLFKFESRRGGFGEGPFQIIVGGGPFQGCVRDLILDGSITYFETSFNSTGAQFGNCLARPGDNPYAPSGPPELIEEDDDTPATTHILTLSDQGRQAFPGRPSSRLQRGSPSREGKVSFVAPKAAASSCPSFLVSEPRAYADPNTLRFGDDRNSYAEFQLSKKFKRGFNITLQFRTFETEGLLLNAQYTGSGKHAGHMTVTLSSGKILASFHNLATSRKKRQKRKPQDIFLHVDGRRLNDGKWHTLSIVKDYSIVLVTVDGFEAKKGVLPTSKFNIGQHLYVGGVPSSAQKRFVGCVRGLEFAGKQVDVASEGRLAGVGQCFRDVEEGAYFTGDSYALYGPASVSPELKFAFSFKPRVSSAMLFAVVAPTTKQMLQLGYHNHQLFIQGPSTSEPVDSPVDICDSKWHDLLGSVTDTGHFQVTLDGIRTIDKRVGNDSGFPGTQVQLFLGGLPAHHTVKGSNNFKGCLRNVEIFGRRSSWTDFSHLQSAHTGSCPV
ncbi:unnamed protein product [Cyprideis torosa]|uniref:Uncharacterized protein n=1 Tax=Cyprideis torosa TaxID=163714 RepID=A0A7R8W469_9CRUS|nr:unnamed protein product [Cyprideis torosa]CAG0883844.1 unnamed protein product [Cyprideis torosa]